MTTTITKKEFSRILRALYTINKKAKRLRDNIRLLYNDLYFSYSDYEKQQIYNKIDKLKIKKRYIYDDKEFYLYKILKIKGIEKYINKKEIHILKVGDYYEDLIGDYIEFKVFDETRGFHYNIRREEVEVEENVKKIEEISAENIKGYKNPEYAQKILEKYLFETEDLIIT